MSDESPLHILAICSRPLLDTDGQPIALLDVAEERRRIETGVKRAGDVARVHFLPEATTGEVKAALRDEWDVVHFTGHGTDDGHLVLEDGFGVAHLLPKQDAAQLLTGQRTPLVVLSACYSETVAHELHAAGVPAVVAVDARVPIADLAAIIFAEHFYAALAKGWEVRRAFEDAQRAVKENPKVGDAKPPHDASGNVEEPWSRRFKLIGGAQKGVAAARVVAHRTAASPPQAVANLHTQSANFVGRAWEIVDVVKAFDETGAQRVAVWGSGGLGKTELAKAVARWYMERTRAGAVLWASASHAEGEYKLRDLASLLSVAARVFGLPITEQTKFDEQKTVVRDFLADARALVLLDNWETIEPQHRRELWDFALSLPEEVRVLVTSRDVLPARDAYNYELDTLAPDAAAELFVKIARNAGYFDRNPQLSAEEWAILTSICERLSGYPLAIEVVAGQTFSRTLGEIWADLQRVPQNVLEGKDELTGEPRGVWTSLDLSYNVLSTDEQSLFRQMCVFLAPASLEDIAAITETKNSRPVLDALVKRSLVRMREGAYSLLPVVRDYAQGRLSDAGQDPRELHTRAVNHYMQKEAIEDALTASDHLFELAARFQLRNAAEAFVGYVRQFYYDLVTRGYWAEARSKTEQWLAVARALGDKQMEAGAIGELGIRYQDIGEYERAAELYRKAQSLLEESKYKREIGGVLYQLGVLAQAQGDYGEAVQLFQQSLEISKELDDKFGIAIALHGLGNLQLLQGNYGEAAQLYQQSLEISKEIDDKANIAATLHQLGTLAHQRGNLREATELNQQSLKVAEELGDKQKIANALHHLGLLAFDREVYEEAAQFHRKSLEICEELGDKQGITVSLHGLGRVAQAQGYYSAAAHLYRQSLDIKEALGDKYGVAISLGQLGEFYRAQGQMKEALSYSLKALTICEELHAPQSQTALQDIASVRDAVGKGQFVTWLRELSTEAERISRLLEQHEANKQRAKEFTEQLVGVAQAVVAARKQGDAEEQTALARQLEEMEAEVREQGATEVADFLAVLRGLLTVEDVTEKIAALVGPLKEIAEQARATSE